MATISNYNELYHFMEETNEIPEDVVAILEELDSTGSMVTQASLNEILLGLYSRLETDKISIAGLGEATKESFRGWVGDKFDNYTVGLFEDGIK